ncbi:phosphoglucosamine mutase [Bartonella tamiae]|uniref:Phosphoglucosamine mutase n=1 Tax=Bartonella tamiae Th239 TaxID=1094558 RepID=J0ZSI3_9HYPH|nr:phosphoglucosamine mutase [Bartonella tamiae]EJF91728.1 phosphoglucosamine mutase [Bartonella tamiae Th239]EJF92604.1 phosphoglucosamine mutase [Bartonella tamiae Th307]
MSRKYFGTDGIRGKANHFPMTVDVAMKVGMAVGILFRNQGRRGRVVIGKDTRLSGYMLENAMVAGFTAAGMEVFLLGPIPTPAVAMLCRSMRADIGVMISASHNAFYDNGLKLFGPDGFKLSDDMEMKIEKLIESDMTDELATQAEIGRAKRVEGDIYRYIEFAKRTLPRDVRLDGMRIVVDCANGAAYKVAPLALWELGAEVITIHDTPNGKNINEDCGSTDPISLTRKVNEVRADAGIALDGDGDRVLMVDEKGRVIDGDQLMAVIAEQWQNNGLLRGGGIVSTVMSNLGLERFLTTKGLTMARTKVGDRYVVEHMRQHGFNIGGEQSGHIVLSDYGTTGDGLVSALQILGCSKETQLPLSELCHRFDPVPQILKNIRVHNGTALNDDTVKSAIKNAEKRLLKNGRLVIRPSGTEPLIRVMAEGDDDKLIENLVDDIADTIMSVRDSL